MLLFSIRSSLSPVSLRVQAVTQKPSLEISNRGDLIQGMSCLSNWRAKMPNRGKWGDPKVSTNRKPLPSLSWKATRIPRAWDPWPPNGSWHHGGCAWLLLEPQRTHSYSQWCCPRCGDKKGACLSLALALPSPAHASHWPNPATS